MSKTVVAGKTLTHQTGNKKVIEGLAHILADTYALALKTQNFHWNVTGPHFPQLHAQFEAQYNELIAAVDILAERIRALGAMAPGSFSEFSKNTDISEPNGESSAEEMVQDLLEGHESSAKCANMVIEVSDEANDVVTTDILTDRVNAHNKTAWMLKSFLA